MLLRHRFRRVGIGAAGSRNCPKGFNRHAILARFRTELLGDVKAAVDNLSGRVAAAASTDRRKNDLSVGDRLAIEGDGARQRQLIWLGTASRD